MTTEDQTDESPVKSPEEILADARTAAAADLEANLATESAARLAAMQLDAPVAIPSNWVATLQGMFAYAREGYEFSVSDDGTHLTGWNMFGYPDALTLDEMNAILSNHVADQARAKGDQLLGQAKDVALRCMMGGIAYPPAWVAYVAAVKTWAAAPAGDPPAQPAIPEGV